MTKQIQTCNSFEAVKRFNVRQLLRSAVAAGFVAGAVSSAFAQDGLTLPSFPADSVTLSLPVSQDVPFSTVIASQQSQPSITKRVGTLLGIKKYSPTSTLHQNSPTITLAPFPSTEPSVAVTPVEVAMHAPEQVVEASSHVPTIACSTGSKTEYKTIELSGEPIVLASADESLSEAINESNVAVQTAAAVDDTAATTSENEPSTELSSESLIDIELTDGLVRHTDEANQRQPELVKRPPAMQLHIGSGASTSTEAAPTDASTRYALSDTSESQKPKDSSPKPFVNTMNVKIEGEPIGGPAVARPTVSSESLLTSKKSALLPMNRGGDTKSLSDKVPAEKMPVDKTFGDKSKPTIGERLEVGLHESSNVETTQPISGVSVEHPEFCQVIKSGERSVSFVGLKAGQTRVALFTSNAAGERKIEIREVVIAGTENRQSDMKSLATEIGRTVHRMYPNSHIEVIAEDEGLTVQGYAGSEEEAKKIIGLVRRTSLQPVVDRLATYK